MNRNNCVALIPAAGHGTRLGRGPKGLIEIDGKKLLVRLLERVAPLVNRVLVAVPEAYAGAFEYLAGGRVELFIGGRTRQETVGILFQQTHEEIILIQDAARPFVRTSSISQVIEAAATHGAAGLFLDPAVPVAIIEDGFAVKSFSRKTAGIFQAPQAFKREILSEAIHETRGRDFQSTAEMVLAAGYRLKSIDGDPFNIKITNPFDFAVAEKIIMNQQEN